MAAAQEGRACWLCGRPLGSRVEWHHPLPKSRGGRVTEPVHPICHRTLHATFSNVELARLAASGEDIRQQPELRPFLRWIAGKPADFHAPTRQRK
ncbi:HNH endonuclease [Jiella endophytica]|uniref:HNH endonuclease n=1 Tax=Jiella endophytica TaxID=2558362 RepID=A0A4Y8RPF6_9HYPH|nr:HNH endonuclease [Jiella endophytica]TFF25201.1 HNH endonuclease [Jiella endophytica]